GTPHLCGIGYWCLCRRPMAWRLPPLATSLHRALAFLCILCLLSVATSCFEFLSHEPATLCTREPSPGRCAGRRRFCRSALAQSGSRAINSYRWHGNELALFSRTQHSPAHSGTSHSRYACVVGFSSRVASRNARRAGLLLVSPLEARNSTRICQ